jgi:hypothetical protein
LAFPHCWGPASTGLGRGFHYARCVGRYCCDERAERPRWRA